MTETPEVEDIDAPKETAAPAPQQVTVRIVDVIKGAETFVARHREYQFAMALKSAAEYVEALEKRISEFEGMQSAKKPNGAAH